jgi:hypothetical protein
LTGCRPAPATSESFGSDHRSADQPARISIQPRGLISRTRSRQGPTSRRTRRLSLSAWVSGERRASRTIRLVTGFSWSRRQSTQAWLLHQRLTVRWASRSTSVSMSRVKHSRRQSCPRRVQVTSPPACPITCAIGSTLILISLTTPRSTRRSSGPARPRGKRAARLLARERRPGQVAPGGRRPHHTFGTVWGRRAGHALAINNFPSDGPAARIIRHAFSLGSSEQRTSCWPQMPTRRLARRPGPESRVASSLHRLSACSCILPVAQPSIRSDEECTMPKSPKPDRAREEPGPGRSTSEAAFNDRRRQIAERNEQASREARKRRAAREHEQLLRRRERDF